MDWKPIEHISFPKEDGSGRIIIKRYDNLDDLLCALHHMPLDELKECTHGGYDGSENEWEFTYSDMVKNIKEMGCYGFANNKEEIHVWFESNVNMWDLIRMLGHEMGHLERPYKRDPMQEEIKADKYGDVAAGAFIIAKQLKKSKHRIAPGK